MTEKAITGNNKKALSFLKMFRPLGLINLVAIDPHSENVTAITRSAVEDKDILSFIERHNEKRNLYFTVNTPVDDAPDSKLKKEHIKEINAVWLDADPDKKKDFNDERIRLLQFAKDLASGDNPPTFVTDSGGGIQAFWLLEKPIKVTPQTQKEAESLSRGLADQYGTDKVQNIDRIMRIPHTMNLPTKRKKGRKRALARSKITGEKYTPKQLKSFITLSEAAEINEFEDVELDMNAIKEFLGTDHNKKFFDILKTNKKINDLWTNRIDMKPSRSDRDFTLAKELKLSGFTLQEVAQILWHFPYGKVSSVRNPRREIIRNYMRSGNDFADKLPQEYIDAIAAQTNPITATKEKSIISEGDQPKRLMSIRLVNDTGKISGRPLLKGLIDMNTITVIYGSSNVGKSFVATDIAGHIAAGQDWGEHKLKKQMGVIYVCAEAGGSYGKRGVALKRRLGIKLNSPFNKFPFEYIKMGVNFLNEKQDIKDVVLLARRQAFETGIKVGMIVVDTLATTFSGGNENSSEDMGKYIDNMKWLQEHADCCVVIVHHSGKDQAAGARGHSSLRAATDTELEVVSDKRGEKYFRQIKTRKQRDGESDTVITFGLQIDDLWLDEDNDMVTTCHVSLDGDKDFEDCTPSIMDDMAPREKAVLQAIHLYDKYSVNPDIPEIKSRGFTHKQIKALIVHDIIECNNILVIDVGTLDVYQLAVMAKPSQAANTRLERGWHTLVKDDFPYLSEQYQLTREGLQHLVHHWYTSNV
jgi:hypothetical protein